MIYAVIKNNEVTNIILWDGVSEWSPPEGTIAVACPDEVGLGWTYENGTFVAPPVPEPVPVPVVLNKVDFLRLFTQAERINIRAAAAVDPVVADYQSMLDAATTVNLQDPDILAGVPLLEQAGLIGPGRAAQILANEPPPASI
jgi:hypothetical protein